MECIDQSTLNSEPDLGTIAQLNHEGDTTYTWDKTNENECRAAEAHFNLLKSKGFLTFKVKRSRRKSPEEAFDPKAGKYVYVAPEIATTLDPKADYVVTPQMRGG